MKTLPLNIGTIHFVGIGGIGMSGIAEILHNLGYKVQGSDLSDSYTTKHLRKLNVPIFIGHKAENVSDASVVVISSAVKSDNPEVVEARAKHLPIVRRAEMLAQLMRIKWSISIAGTHGKTTTTSLIGTLLESGGKDPTIVNGGIINSIGTNAKLGKGEWIVVEADESDGTFIKLPSTVAVVTNIDPEHLEHFGSFEALHQSFVSFVQNIPFYGFGVVCLDHPHVQTLVAKVTDRRLVTYGFSPQADVRAENIAYNESGSSFDVLVRDRKTGEHKKLGRIELPIYGQHNISNSLAAIIVAYELEIPFTTIANSLKSFAGVKRRFTKTGEVNGVTIIDDYAHHPVEILAVLKAARNRNPKGKIIAVVQPHRYTRVRDLFNDFCTCFNDADQVILADIYPAGEQPIEGISQDTLLAGIVQHGHHNVRALKNAEELPDVIADTAGKGDLVVCMGAGSITYWANDLPEKLEKVLKRGKAVSA